jgi:hypothetical protein
LTKHKSIRPAAAGAPADEGTAVRARIDEAAASSRVASSSVPSSGKHLVEGTGDTRVESARVTDPGGTNPGRTSVGASAGNSANDAPPVLPPLPGRLDLASGSERERRMSEQIERAQALLLRLAPSDRRRRLLRVAIVRRDETLLAAFLQELDG